MKIWDVHGYILNHAKEVSRVDNFADLAAALEGHQVTDDEGNIPDEDTSIEESATQEPNADEESVDNEEQKDEKSEDTQSNDDDSDQPSYAEDESGKKYVPETAFKKNYAKRKEAERKAAALEQELNRLRQVNMPKGNAPKQLDKTEALENELLFIRMPEFDPNSDKYNGALDVMAADIYRAYTDTKGKPTITKLQAAQEAKKRAAVLAEQLNDVRASAKAVKQQQSDNGMTARVARRDDSKPDVDKMSPEELENFMRANGMW